MIGMASVDDRFAQARKVLEADFKKFCLTAINCSPVYYQEGRVWDLEYARILLSSRLRRSGKKVPIYVFNIDALIA